MIDNIPNTEIVTNMEDKVKALHSQILACQAEANRCNEVIQKAQEQVGDKMSQIKVIEAEIETVKQEAMVASDARNAQMAKAQRMAAELQRMKTKIAQANELRNKVSEFVSDLTQEEMDSFFVDLLGDAQEQSNTHVYLLDRREKMSPEEEAFFSQDREVVEDPFASQDNEAFSFRTPE